MKKWNHLVILAALLASSAWATQPSDVLFVIMGGRTSCGSGNPAATSIGMYKPFASMLNDFKTKYREVKFHYLVSCLNTDPPPDGEAPFVTSENPGKEESGDARIFRSYIQNWVNSGKGEPAVFIVGHSYGGWLAMHLAETLSLPQKLDALVTVDPISTECGPAGVVLGSSACSGAPTDLNNVAIKSHAGRWVNFYQDSDWWLHSSSIPEAENYHVGYHGPHTEIDADARTWKVIRDVVAKRLNP
jgi:pimeloyl-ACP methyl ester carboxylesterase